MVEKFLSWFPPLGFPRLYSPVGAACCLVVVAAACCHCRGLTTSFEEVQRFGRTGEGLIRLEFEKYKTESEEQ